MEEIELSNVQTGDNFTNHCTVPGMYYERESRDGCQSHFGEQREDKYI
jgi:hypothetical protein